MWLAAYWFLAMALKIITLAVQQPSKGMQPILRGCAKQSSGVARSVTSSHSLGGCSARPALASLASALQPLGQLVCYFMQRLQERMGHAGSRAASSG